VSRLPTPPFLPSDLRDDADNDDIEKPPRPNHLKRRRMDLEPDGDFERTPRPPSKRLREAHGSPSRPVLSPAPSRSPNSASASASASEYSIESHRSGRASPTKQLQVLETAGEPLCYCNFGDAEEHDEREDVVGMAQAIEDLGDGVGILGYPEAELRAVEAQCPSERRRFRRAWSSDPEQRLRYGEMPSIRALKKLVSTARQNDRGTGTPEDDWNTQVHFALLKMACETSVHAEKLDVYGVYDCPGCGPCHDPADPY
jgi:hypothetical protein